MSGKILPHSFSAEKIKTRLLTECILRSECYKCGFHERRPSDMRQPFLLNFKDTNKNNWSKNNLEILSSGFERIPTTTVKLSEEQQADVEKLLERLEDDDDVQNVYHSMEM